jgi:hypothetical protein
MAAKDDDAAAYDVATPSKPDPVTVHFTVGNTYRQLSPAEASYDRTGRHLKIHDWTLYVDVLPGQDPDIIDRVTFDMRDNSFATQAFTCHCPIRIQAGIGSAFIGQISGCDNRNNSQAQFGQATKEEEDKSVPTSSTTRPHPNVSRWRFSTRQQTYGSVDVQISIRGRGGCKSIVPYTVVLRLGGHECPEGSLTPFVEKRPHQPLKPLKMMDSEFAVEIQFPTVDGSGAGSCSSLSLSEIAKSVYGRSKIPILLEQTIQPDGLSGKSCGSSLPWLMKLNQPTSHGKIHDNMINTTATISISSPILVGGHGLNECYKIIEGLTLSSCILPSNNNIPRPLSSSCTTRLYVQIDVTSLSVQQIVKVCQNFVKYEDAMDSFMPCQHREDRSEYCRSNKQAVEGNTNKQRNQRISKCETMEDLLNCFNPVEEHHYKLHLRRIGMGNAIPNVITNDAVTTPKRAIEFRQHVSPKDKTVMTHWVRFCSAFVRNSSRLRSPSALKSTTSLDEEFELLFEYVVKDRALRNYYRMRRDEFMLEDEKDACCLGVLSEEVENVGKSSSDSMSISEECCCCNDDATSAFAATALRKRSDTPSQLELNKRACLQLLKS